jgi:hypothetical protein
MYQDIVNINCDEYVFYLRLAVTMYNIWWKSPSTCDLQEQMNNIVLLLNI